MNDLELQLTQGLARALAESDDLRREFANKWNLPKLIATAESELSITGGRLDVVLTGPTASIWIEGKVDSPVDQDQLAKYREALEGESADSRALVLLARVGIDKEAIKEIDDSTSIRIEALNWQELGEWLQSLSVPAAKQLAQDFRSAGVFTPTALALSDFEAALHIRPSLLNLVGLLRQTILERIEALDLEPTEHFHPASATAWRDFPTAYLVFAPTGEAWARRPQHRFEWNFGQKSEGDGRAAHYCGVVIEGGDCKPSVSSHYEGLGLRARTVDGKPRFWRELRFDEITDFVSLKDQANAIAEQVVGVFMDLLTKAPPSRGLDA